MLAKTIIAATLALAATVQAEVPNHTHFNDPVAAPDDLSTVFIAGGNFTFSWTTSCASGEVISPNPTAVDVQLVKADSALTASLVTGLGKLDCSGTSGHSYWTPPLSEADKGHAYAIRLVLGPKDVYSGRFLIKSKENMDKPATPSGGATNPGATPAGKTNSAGILTPVLAGAAAVAAGALMFL
ncbi:hypothetical protein BGZ97_009389 [Linnemannia gamsii]|uniref:Uncharacterized protein n=1 Tax=Linnemannia gamsii TaxID=64522 RepID=A0A9P6RMR9_9FUNG|nr:hypothetical protein BGZ97_009389 [Linnemannia gamsii]